MKVSTNLFFDRALNQMVASQSSLAQSQAQLSTGKKVVQVSDAPDEATAIQRLKSVIARQDSFEQAVKTAQNRLNAEETALEATANIMVRMKELTVQALNDTYGPKDREIIAVEMQGLQEDLLSYANTRDVNGAYLFSGSRVFTPPFAANAQGDIVYQGDETVNLVEVGDQRSLRLNRTGTEVFGRVTRDLPNGSTEGRSFFQSVQDLVDAVRTSDRGAMNRGLAEFDTLNQQVAISQAKVGSAMNVVSNQTAVLEETRLQLRTVLSEIEDLDYTEAVTEMQKRMMALEASQASFAQISRLNLFEYIR
ncbi:MAG: flagellar hook-associated protein FlgL [Burkholderiaceae bacterium]|jgi:flagellar hook-associated protein 3 FlgL|nr:flagellar hook-associated protein FlgL [Pseudomonadota bacterium]MDP4949456.1 flagellar hook-associated protein FlgL [Burkholderiaceae bacterium]